MLMSWPAADETRPYPWAAVPCPGCDETELAAARGFRPSDFVCMTCGYLTQICRPCLNSGHVCEDHPECAWGDGDGCCGAAGMPCPACCDPIPLGGTHRIRVAFQPRHLRGAR